MRAGHEDLITLVALATHGQLHDGMDKLSELCYSQCDVRILRCDCGERLQQSTLLLPVFLRREPCGMGLVPPAPETTPARPAPSPLLSFPRLQYRHHAAQRCDSMRAPFAWYGGKANMAKRIVALLPQHSRYIEPFAGAASVFFRKSPAREEILSDQVRDKPRRSGRGRIARTAQPSFGI